MILKLVVIALLRLLYNKMEKLVTILMILNFIKNLFIVQVCSSILLLLFDIVSDLQTISLSCFDFDDQPASILYNSSTSPSMRVLISHWPLNGSGILYFLNGTEIEQRSSPVQVPYDASTHSYSVRFRPPFNVISEK